ncbi:MAG: SulP family inorganic anion transporter [Akkermansiaceae bacterium]
MPSIRKTFSNASAAIKKFFTENSIEILPVRNAVKEYKKSQVKYDIKAAFNVALLTLPQGMAYAAIAELPIYYGIISSIIASIVAPLFSSSRHTILGPSNATALMVFTFFASSAAATLAKAPIAYMPLLVFLVGIILLLGSLFKLADLLQFVSRSVLVGYITGAALLIMNGQFKHIFGVAEPLKQIISTHKENNQAVNFFTSFFDLTTLWNQFQWQPILLGIFTLALYLALMKKLPILPNFALCLAASSIIALTLKTTTANFTLDCFKPFQLDNFNVSLPDFNFNDIATLTGVAFAIAFLASLENTVMGKSLGSRTGERPDVNQDMFALGMSNIACSFLTPMPASGSLTRSALNFESGAKSRFSSIYASLFCIVGFFILLKLPIVENIPKASLAALVVGIAISLIKWKNIRICLNSTRDDAIVVIVTFAATLLTRLDSAIFIGVALSISLFLRKASRPHLVEYEVNDEGDLRELDTKQARPNPAISIVHVEGNLYFGAADLFRTQVQHTAADPNLKVVILRMKNARHLDATSVMALDELIKHMRKQGRHVIISGATRNVYKVLKQSGVLETILKGCDRSQGETNLFFSSPSNPNLSTRDALLRAQELLGTKEADIKIFFDPNQEKK